jgi:GNAT superfamily N-acetyltransferase
MGTPLVVGEHVCVATVSGKVSLTEPDAKERWSFQLGGTCHATPTAADGFLVVGCDDGLLYAFREKREVQRREDREGCELRGAIVNQSLRSVPRVSLTPRHTSMARTDVTVYYLEMTAHAARAGPPPREGLSVIQAHRPSVAYYRFLYHTVGSAYYWFSRGKLSDADLAATLHDPRNEVHVLFVDGVPAGFVELDRRVEGEVEIVQFGLMPEFIGQGLGKWFLQWTIDRVWSYRPRRLWLHTCTLDHPTALPNYLKAGFTIWKQESIQRELAAGRAGPPT